MLSEADAEQVTQLARGPLPMKADGAYQPDPLLLDACPKQLLQDDLDGPAPDVLRHRWLWQAGVVEGDGDVVAGLDEGSEGWRTQGLPEGT